jgi:hypothetical protein
VFAQGSRFAVETIKCYSLCCRCLPQTKNSIAHKNKNNLIMSKRKFDDISTEHELEQIAHIDEILDRIFVHLDSKTLYKSILPACKQWNRICKPYLLTNYCVDAIESVKNYFLNYDFSRYEGDDKVELCTKNNK